MAELFAIDLERDSLHRQLGGGIPKGSLILITGDTGAGKSALCQRMTYSLLKHGYTVTYISSELTTKSFIEQMNSLDYPVKPYLLSKNLLYVPVFPLITRAESRPFVERLLSEPRLFDTDVSIIDTLSSLLRSSSEAEALLAIQHFRRVASRNKAVMITADPTELDLKTLQRLRTHADIYIDLQIDMSEGSIQHLMVVRRFLQAQARVGNVVGFRIEPGLGLILDITTVA